jgi:hypothetical protein
MEDRVAFIAHQGHQILLIDFSHCSGKEIQPLLERIRYVVARHERGSVLTLADLREAHIDRETAMKIKETLVLDRPFVKRSAWVGAESLPKAYIDNFRSFSQRDFHQFATREEAMDWLVSENNDTPQPATP